MYVEVAKIPHRALWDEARKEAMLGVVCSGRTTLETSRGQSRSITLPARQCPFVTCSPLFTGNGDIVCAWHHGCKGYFAREYLLEAGRNAYADLMRPQASHPHS